MARASSSASASVVASPVPDATPAKKRGRPPKSAGSSAATPQDTLTPDDPKSSSRVKRNGSHVLLDDDSTAPRRFMLHRTLATVDLFTSPAPLSTDDLAQLADVADTDVISVLPSTSAPEKRRRLKDVVAPPTRQVVARRALPPAPTPVTPLYYSPFSSFAPSYDSTSSTTSYSNSCRLFRSSTALERHYSNNLIPRPVLPTLKGPLLSAEDRRMLTELAFDPDAVEMGWQTALQAEEDASRSPSADEPTDVKEKKNSEKLDEELFINSLRLGELWRAQWSRLLSQTRSDAARDAKTSGAEEALARSLVASLSTMIARLPPSSVVPPANAVRAQAAVVMGVEADEEEWRGTLPVTDARAVKESGMTREEDEVKQLEP